MTGRMYVILTKNYLNSRCEIQVTYISTIRWKRKYFILVKGRFFVLVTFSAALKTVHVLIQKFPHCLCKYFYCYRFAQVFLYSDFLCLFF